eukprot:3938776-Rhodomonas_salina.6
MDLAARWRGSTPVRGSSPPCCTWASPVRLHVGGEWKHYRAVGGGSGKCPVHASPAARLTVHLTHTRTGERSSVSAV